MKADRYIIETIVFISGALVMVFEIAGSRVLGPYLGTSLFVWTSLIGIILGSLSLGYHLGGKWADLRPQMEILSLILFLAGIAVGLTILMKDPFLNLLQQRIPDVRVGSVLASIFLFAPASILLGMVSPYSVKLKMENLKTSGATVGNLYAISTLGSILGTFLAGFYLIPTIGTDRILELLIVMLALLSLMTSRTHLKKKLVILTIIFVNAHMTNVAQAREGLIDVDTIYNRVWIYDEDNPRHGLIRNMKVNNENSSAMFLENDELVYEYTKYYHLVRHFKPDFKRALMIGGAAYSYPKDFIKKYPHATLDVVEIDPKLTELAKQYFGLVEDSRLTVYHEDGRIFINRSHEKYDAIFGDAFSSQYSIPYQLTTQEAAQRKYDLLNEGGVVILNIISSIEGEKGQFLRAEVATYKSIFPHVFILPVSAPNRGDLVQNIVLLAIKSEMPPSFHSDDPVVRQQLGHLWKQDIPNDLPILTDDHAPVDYYAGKAL